MLKSLLIRIRRKPKVVREQFALWSAGLFTLLIFGFWAFNLPDRFDVDTTTQNADIFSTLQAELERSEISLESVQGDLEEFMSTTTDLVADINFTTSTIERKLPAVAEEPVVTPESSRSIRLATTSIDAQNASTSP